MQTRQTRQPRPQRNGFSLLELVVVLFVIALLVALTLPVQEHARASSRKLSCLN
ncbi:MAG TPA: prepilin-type cleavage/methylation domain-containing protein, partial [Planctomycetaceae bacterium]|nr:prepilin-type cleavage/methylation domain-containing protein [Planctomycetaceae bacterium]